MSARHPKMHALLARVFLCVFLAGWLAAPAAADPTKKRKVLIISAEQGGVFTSGGLGHATQGLAKALNEAGHQADVILPFYTELPDEVQERIKPTGERYTVGLDYDSRRRPRASADFTVHTQTNDKVRTFLFRHEVTDPKQSFFYNPKNVSALSYGPYGPGDRLVRSFGAMAKAVTEWAKSKGYDHVIFNDWPGGIAVPFFREMENRPHLIGAVHNMAYQNQDLANTARYLGIPDKYLTSDTMMQSMEIERPLPPGATPRAAGEPVERVTAEMLNPMRGTVSLTDATYTVARTHAYELSTPRFGEGMEDIVRQRTEQGRMFGIPNGIDDAAWDPANRYHRVIRHTFTPEDLSGKKRMKMEIQKRFGLPREERTPLLVLTSRLADQKGFGDPRLGRDYMVQALDAILAKNNVQVIITGDGEEIMKTRLFELQTKYPYRFRYLPFNAEREKILTAGADAFVNFSRYEPSGLNQFFSLKNGTIPIVSRTGGLADSVRDGVNGFSGEVHFLSDGKTVDPQKTAAAAEEAMQRFLNLYKDNPWKLAAMRKAAMRESHTWASRVPEFEALFDYLERSGPEQLARNRVRLPVNGGYLPSQVRGQTFPGAPGYNVVDCKVSFGKLGKEAKQ